MTPLFVATGDAVARVEDGRAEVVLEQPGAQCVAVDARNPERVLVGCREGGLLESEDGGETWEDHRPGAQRDVHSLAWHPTQPGRA